MKFCIPSIGTKIRLDKDWTFTLFSEGRNESLGAAVGHYTSDPKAGIAGGRWSDGHTSWGNYHENVPSCRPITDVTLPKGTVLTVDRIYLRKGADEYDSITFNVNDAKTIFADFKGFVRPSIFGDQKRKPIKRVRFWAKLDDVNKIDFSPVSA